MRNDDIDGTKPGLIRFKTKRESSNPLNPVYKLPSYEPLEPIIPKFIRDSIEVTDIAGTKPKTFHQKNLAPRVTNNVRDIDGARPKKDYQRKEVISPLDVKDINEYRMFRTTRMTNPMEPTYVVPGEKPGEKDSIGFIQGSKSKILHPNLPHGVPDYSGSLLNKDIDGAKAGTVGNRFIKQEFRTTFRNLTETKDISGAQTGTLKKGIQTKRLLNPLDPKYEVPGHIQDRDYILTSYGGAASRQRKPAEGVTSPSAALSRTHAANFTSGSKASNADAAVPAVSVKEVSVPHPAASAADLGQALEHSAPAAVPTPKQGTKTPSVGHAALLPTMSPPVERSHHEAGHRDTEPLQEAKTGSGQLPTLTTGSIISGVSQKEQKPLYKRIDREEYMKDVNKFYGTGGFDEDRRAPPGPAGEAHAAPEPSKISKIMESIENQKKVMNQLDKKQRDVYVQTKL